MSKKEYVVLKGSAEGVNMIIDELAPINDIMDSMREKIKSAGSFFKGECDIFVSGRELSKSDELRITSVMKTVFPEANIVYRKIVKEPETPEITPRNHTHKGARFMEELTKAAEYSREMLKSDKAGGLKPQRFDVKSYIGDIKYGEVLKTTGDILVVGNVEKGGLVSAEGSVYILGNLSGKAEAGIRGDEACCIYAAGFAPQGVRIADISMEFDEFAQESFPKMTYLLKRVIYVEKFL